MVSLLDLSEGISGLVVDRDIVFILEIVITHVVTEVKLNSKAVTMLHFLIMDTAPINTYRIQSTLQLPLQHANVSMCLTLVIAQGNDHVLYRILQRLWSIRS